MQIHHQAIPSIHADRVGKRHNPASNPSKKKEDRLSTGGCFSLSPREEVMYRFFCSLPLLLHCIECAAYFALLALVWESRRCGLRRWKVDSRNRTQRSKDRKGIKAKPSPTILHPQLSVSMLNGKGRRELCLEQVHFRFRRMRREKIEVVKQSIVMVFRNAPNPCGKEQRMKRKGENLAKNLCSSRWVFGENSDILWLVIIVVAYWHRIILSP